MGWFFTMKSKAYTINNEMGQLLNGVESQLKDIENSEDNDKKLEVPKIVTNRVERSVRLRNSVENVKKEVTDPVLTKVKDMISDIFK